MRISVDTGGTFAHVEFEPVDCEMMVAYASDGTMFPAEGARGGGAASRARQLQRGTDGVEEELEACPEVRLGPGEVMVSITQPGGGYGPPAEREPERVANDVAESWISAAGARRVYKVVVDELGRVDPEATAALRRAGWTHRRG